MQNELLKVSQYVLKHPIKDESEEYKIRYINALEYFVRKYSEKDIYSHNMLELYKNKLMEHPKSYKYDDSKLKYVSKGKLKLKPKRFKFFLYKYCFLIDVIFICSVNDNKKSEQIFKEILDIYNQIYSNRYLKRCKAIFSVIIGKNKKCPYLEQVGYILECINVNRDYLCKKNRNILVTANMSAGKSTLINALIGKKVNKTQNDSCTAKTHYLINKSFEDNLSYKYDYDLELDAQQEILMKDNEKNESNNIYVGTRFRTIGDVNIPICFIDTPGVNSSQDKEHKEITEKDIIELKYEKLMYVMNGENIGTDDERRHLEFIAENYKGNIIFVVNKLDCYRKDDSIPNTLYKVKKDLEGLGYKQPIICPISAYAAYLAKMNLFGEELNDYEMDEIDILYRKFSRDEYQLNKYYPSNYQDISDISEDKDQQLLLHSGVLSLEKILYEER